MKYQITHFQQLSLISLVDLGWTPDFQAFFYFQEIIGFLLDDLLPLECLLQNFGYNIYTQKVLATNVFPIALSFLVFLIWITFLRIITSRDSLSKNKVLQIIQVTFFIIVLIFFPEVIGSCLSFLTCLNVEDSESYQLLLYSPDVECWSEEHKNYLLYVALPGFIAWGLVAPAIIGYNLLKYKSEIRALLKKERKIQKGSLDGGYDSVLNTDSSSKSNLRMEKAIPLKFLCKGYSRKYYYWELFIFMKKFLLIAIGSISDLFPSKLRGVFLLIPISCFLLIQVRLHPLETVALNKLEFFSLLTIFLTANMGILMFSRDFQKYAITTLIFVVGINCLFLLYWLQQFFKQIFRNYLRKEKSIY